MFQAGRIPDCAPRETYLPLNLASVLGYPSITMLHMQNVNVEVLRSGTTWKVCFRITVILMVWFKNWCVTLFQSYTQQTV